MVLKRQLCPHCERGRISYELDRHSCICPHIVCLKDGRCRFYEPVKKKSRVNVLAGGKSKKNVENREK